MLWLTKPMSTIANVMLLLVIMHSFPLSIFLWILGLVGSFLIILLVHTASLNRSTLLVSSWNFLFLGVCIQFSTVLSQRRLKLRLVTLYLVSMISYLFALLQLLLGSLRLRAYWIIMFMVEEGPLNGDFLSSGMAIHFIRHLET